MIIPFLIYILSMLNVDNTHLQVISYDAIDFRE